MEDLTNTALDYVITVLLFLYIKNIHQIPETD